jgi:hypothetical protein
MDNTMTAYFTLKRLMYTLTLFAMLLAFVSPVQAALEAKEKAFELTAEQILHWPLREGDNLVVQPCTGCGVETLRVEKGVHCSIGFDGEHISLRELLRQESLLPANADHLVIVFFHPDDRQVTRIILQTEL